MDSSADRDRQADAAGGQPALLDPVAAIEMDLAGLSHATPARATPFLAEGERCSVRGLGSRAGFTVEIDGRVVATVSAPDLGTAANVLSFPGVIRRDFIGSVGSSVETLLATPSLPLVVAQWRSPSERTPGQVVVDREADDVAVGLYPPPPSERESAPNPAGTPRAVFVPSDAELTTLVVSAGAPDTIRAAFAAARHAPAHAVRAAAGPEGGLLLHTGVSEVDDGVRWLRSRLVGQLRRDTRQMATAGARGVAGTRRADREPAIDAIAGLPMALAGLCVGERDAVDALLARILSDGGRDPMASSVDAATALIAARFAAVFGETRHAAAVARTWLVGRRIDEPGSPTGLAAEMLANALHRTGDPGTITGLRAIADRARGAAPQGAPPRTGAPANRPLPMTGATKPDRPLPMAGAKREGAGHDVADHAEPDPDAPDPAGWWRAVISGEPRPPVPTTGSAATVRARRAGAGFRTDPETAWAEWRALLGQPFGDDGPTALWDDPDEPAGGSGTAQGSLTAELLLALVSGLLGVEADAPAGRIRIAPRIPSHLTRLAVGGIRVGACAIGVRYDRSDGIHRFELEPESARVPPLVVLEPAVPGRVSAVRIDGDAAALDPRPSGNRTVVPVQLPLDAVRRLEIETG